MAADVPDAQFSARCPPSVSVTVTQIRLVSEYPAATDWLDPLLAVLEIAPLTLTEMSRPFVLVDHENVTRWSCPLTALTLGVGTGPYGVTAFE